MSVSNRSTVDRIKTYKRYQREAGEVQVDVYDKDGIALDCSTASEIEVWGRVSQDGASVFEKTKTGGDITVGGTNDNELTFTLTRADRDRTGLLWIEGLISWSATRKRKFMMKYEFAEAPG